ncbi:hypothetical protein DPMN_032046 [Dreissena polymorpha]|uniref:Uncharacterized protein n=1 Tax=Dreissena polymorpha TaxID=45954 RepID=A0A9D4RHL8_DREPO|nr:hypothetical protein DPMN_032046 [Dreissena polymorpha]
MLHERNLFFWLGASLLELRTALSTKQLPYYMIPERNLTAATGVNDTQNRTWIATLTDVMDEGPKIVRRLPKVRHAIISHPGPLLWYAKKTVELEILILEETKSISVTSENCVGNILDHILRPELMVRVHEIVHDIFEQMRSEGSTQGIFYLRCPIYLNDC